MRLSRQIERRLLSRNLEIIAKCHQETISVLAWAVWELFANKQDSRLIATFPASGEAAGRENKIGPRRSCEAAKNAKEQK